LPKARRKLDTSPFTMVQLGSVQTYGEKAQPARV